MVILAYDIQGVILGPFVPHGETVNVQYYAEYLQNHLRLAVRRKRPQFQNVPSELGFEVKHKKICRTFRTCTRVTY